MKKIAKLLVLTLASLALLASLIACGANAELSLKDDAMPQTVFVLGEELDLSGGVLSVKSGDESYEVDMTDDGVGISGYDKDTLGEQTVTVTYGGGSVELKVTVVERMVVSDYKTDYLVGDTVDLTKGRLKITRNDGSNFTVALGSNKVTVEGFDSATVGERTLTAKYVSDGNEYTASFKVNVREVEEIVLNAPTKITYKSHEEKIDLTGGFLTFYGMNGEVKRDLPITEDMISGFDLSAVKSDNTPYTQKITVTYDGKDYTYDIVITYTSVSDFIDSADFVDKIDFAAWDAWENFEELPEISDADGALANRIIELYMDMSPAEKTLIDSDKVLKVARAAMAWSFGEWSEDVLTFSDAFGVEGGSIMFYCESEQAVKDALVELKNTDRPIYEYADIIADLAELFAKEKVYGEMLFEDFPIIPVETYDDVCDVFEYMLALDEKFDAIPVNWREIGFEGLDETMNAARDAIVNSDFYNYSYTQIFYLVSSWRDADDAFDALYTYYYGKEDVESLIYLANVRLPKELELIYSYAYMALEQANAIENYQVVDTSNLFYAIHMAHKISEELLAGDDEMQQILFYSIPLNGMLGLPSDEDTPMYTFDMMLNLLMTGEGGFNHFSGALLGVEEYHALMDKYMNIIELWSDDVDGSYENSEQYKSDVEELLALFMQLSPAEQFSFTSTLNVFYGMSMPPLAFEAIGDYEGFESTFATILREHYQSLFTTDAAKAAYVDLMVATELFAQRNTNTEWKTEFFDRLKAVRDAYGDMNDADKSTFENKLLPILIKYEGLGAAYGESGGTVDYKGWENKFNELYEAMVNVELSYQLVNGGYPYYGLFLSAFERAQKLAAEIMTAPKDVIDIYLYEGLYSNKELDKYLDPEWVDDDPTTTVYWSYDYMIALYRSIYISAINSSILGGSSMYDYYVEINMGEFLNTAYDLIWALMESTDADTNAYDKEKSLAAIKAFLDLDSEAQYMFLVYIEGMGGGLESLFIQAVSKFINEDYTQLAANAADNLIYLEISYMTYYMIGDAESLEALKKDLEDLKTVYSLLADSDSDKASFVDFEEAYASIVEKVEAAIAEAEADTENEETPAA